MTGPSERHGPPPWVTERWHGRRPARGLILRFLFGFVALLVFVDLIIVLLVSLVARAFGFVDMAPGGVVATVGALLLFFMVFGVAAGPVRRYGMPLARLVDAITRVADGDYTVRVDAHGSRSVRRLVTAFNEMVERLATAEDRRHRLLADVTHELRTPLAVVQGQLEGTLDGVYPRDDEHLSAILDETRYMARIIEDLRTLSLAESGALPLTREPVAIGDLVADAVEAYRGQAEGAGVTLAPDVAAALPPVDADATRVRQVLENLLSNALRYTPRGGRVDVSVDRDGNEAIAVSVRDTGRGIAPADLDRVFDRFQRAADSHGSGLGLSIARDLVRAHGGEISAASGGEGRGTTVRFTLPVAD